MRNFRIDSLSGSHRNNIFNTIDNDRLRERVAPLIIANQMPR